MGHGSGKKPRGGMMRTASRPVPPRAQVRGRCDATHDVPYTLRCVHWMGHDLNGQPHIDKEGNEW